jgi:predicted membrane protein (TIGR00267 family)
VSWSRATGRENLFSPVTGFADGILTALTFAAGRLLAPSGAGSLSLALRVAAAAAVSGAFVAFAAHYARLRGELVRAERQLNLTTHGRLAATKLGGAVRREAMRSALISSVCAFLGALLPMLVGAALPSPGWLAVASAIVALGALGAGVGRATYGSPLWWALALVGAGLALTGLGLGLHVI